MASTQGARTGIGKSKCERYINYCWIKERALNWLLTPIYPLYQHWKVIAFQNAVFLPFQSSKHLEWLPCFVQNFKWDFAWFEFNMSFGVNNPRPSLRWRHNGRDSVSNHQPHQSLFNRLFRRRSKKTSKLRVSGFCAGNSPGSVNSPHKWPVTRKIFPFDDVTMLITTRRDCNELKQNVDPCPAA